MLLLACCDAEALPRAWVSSGPHLSLVPVVCPAFAIVAFSLQVVA
jgi:hypothetical protein